VVVLDGSKLVVVRPDVVVVATVLVVEDGLLVVVLVGLDVVVEDGLHDVVLVVIAQEVVVVGGMPGPAK